MKEKPASGSFVPAGIAQPSTSIWDTWRLRLWGAPKAVFAQTSGADVRTRLAPPGLTCWIAARPAAKALAAPGWLHPRRG